ncbi:MAG: hypothetical protein ACTSRP_01600, partial [Candidatus Helarchaeota archaeon]
KEEKSNLKEILKMLYLKGYNEKYQLSSNLYHPNFFKKVFFSWWESLTSLKIEKLKNSDVINTIDLEFYDLKNLPFEKSKIIEDLLIFKDKLNRIEGLNLIIKILEEIKDNIENPQIIINSFCKNLRYYFSNPYFREENEINREELKDYTLKFLENLYNLSKKINPENFNKFLLTDEQYEKCHIFFNDEEAFTINNSPSFRFLRDMIYTNKDFININLKSIFTFFELKKIFPTIKNSFTLQMIEDKIFKLNNNKKRQIIIAFNYLLKQFNDVFASQKQNEYRDNFENILNKKWIDIGNNLYSLKNLYLKDQKLEFKLDFTKEYAYFDDFCLEKNIPIEDVNSFIDFFEIKPITLDDLIYFLDVFSQGHKSSKKDFKILKLMTFLTEKENIYKIINDLKDKEIIPVIDVNNNLSHVFSLNHLLKLDYVFFSSKEFIIEELLKKWKEAPEFQNNSVFLLFDKENSYFLNKWKKVLERMLKSIDNNLQLINIEDYPIPSLDNELIKGDEPIEQYRDEVNFLREICTFLKEESTKNTLKPLDFRKIKLECLENTYKIQKMQDIKGNLIIPNFKGKPIQISNVSISKFFKIRENNIIQYYGLQKSDLRDFFYRYLYENLFPNEDKSESQIKDELEIFKNIINWYEDRDSFLDSSGKINLEKLRNYLINYKNLELKSKKDLKERLREYLDSFQRWINILINRIENIQENFLDLCSKDELLKLLNFIRNKLIIKDNHLKIPFTKVKIGINEYG